MLQKIRFARYFFNTTKKFHSKAGYYGYKPRKLSDYLATENEVALQNRIANANLYELVQSYRKHGHKKATLDPLELREISSVPELNPALYGLSLDDEKKYDLNGIVDIGAETATIQELVQQLESIYCGTIAVEYDHLSRSEERSWFVEEYENTYDAKIGDEKRKAACLLMLKSQMFDKFMHLKYSTVKRYGGEGCEGIMAFFEEALSVSAELNIEDVIVCIAHRGRLNLLQCLLGYPAVNMFRKMKGYCEFPEGVDTTGDVLSHLAISKDLQFGDGKVHVTLLPNPSHLETINPVCVGKARSKHLRKVTGDYNMSGSCHQGDKVIPFQIHGDAAFSAQGITAETFALSMAAHYHAGGSLHLITNNQLGFTTPGEKGRSSLYSSDVGKIVDCPVIHVNGDCPEDVMRACRIAMSYRQLFRKDVIVDLFCWRRWGHNELDDPSFTNPTMYQIINARKSVPDMYATKLCEEGIMTKEEAATVQSDYFKELTDELERIETYKPQLTHFQGVWSGFVQAPHSIQTWDTGVDADLLRFVGAKSISCPDDFKMHDTLKKFHVDVRLKKLRAGEGLDWATAEALAFGSLLTQGYSIRIAGQDVGRGTFNHRHAMMIDQNSGEPYIPLNEISADQENFLEVCNSILSEEAVLAFEYGISIDNPKCLCIWEAQFGDFFNGAQIVIDTCISSGEVKWLLQSGIVMLLPHGYDGAGPEHSSARIERFLQLTDSKEDKVDGDHVNMHIVNPTTPAQYFHLLRRQMLRNYRKPLVVFSPKLMLRLPAATSKLSDMEPGTHFLPVISDDRVSDKDSVKKIIFCSGKHFYALQKHRDTVGATDTAIVRIESLCPFPVAEIQRELKKFPQSQNFVWSQEEPRNMGVWPYAAPRFENLVGIKLLYVGRTTMPCPATGIGKVHAREAEEVVSQSFT